MYRVQYKRKGMKTDVWRNVRVNNRIEEFTNLEQARHCMMRCYNSGYDARIIMNLTKWEWIEKKEW